MKASPITGKGNLRMGTIVMDLLSDYEWVTNKCYPIVTGLQKSDVRLRASIPFRGGAIRVKGGAPG